MVGAQSTPEAVDTFIGTNTFALAAFRLPTFPYGDMVLMRIAQPHVYAGAIAALSIVAHAHWCVSWEELWLPFLRCGWSGSVATQS